MHTKMHVAIEDADFELDSMVVEWMQLTKCKKSLKLFQAKVEKSEVKTERNQSFVLDKFEKFVREQENERKTNDVDDLGFEINFGTFQKEPKVRLTSNPHIPNIDAISGALFTLRNQDESTQTRCDECARDDIDIWYLGITSCSYPKLKNAHMIWGLDVNLTFGSV